MVANGDEMERVVPRENTHAMCIDLSSKNIRGNIAENSAE